MKKWKGHVLQPVMEYLEKEGLKIPETYNYRSRLVPNAREAKEELLEQVSKGERRVVDRLRRASVKKELKGDGSLKVWNKTLEYEVIFF